MRGFTREHGARRVAGQDEDLRSHGTGLVGVQRRTRRRRRGGWWEYARADSQLMDAVCLLALSIIVRSGDGIDIVIRIDGDYCVKMVLDQMRQVGDLLSVAKSTLLVGHALIIPREQPAQDQTERVRAVGRRAAGDIVQNVGDFMMTLLFLPRRPLPATSRRPSCLRSVVQKSAEKQSPRCRLTAHCRRCRSSSPRAEKSLPRAFGFARAVW